VIGSLDVIARIEELEAIVPPSDEDEGFTNDEHQALATLMALQDEAILYSPSWKYGSTLIRDSYFEEYTEQLDEKERNGVYYLVLFDGVSYWIK
jgi:hypothetical protein